MADFDHCSEEIDKLRVRIRQSEDGRKKKIKLENDFMKVTIRVKDKAVLQDEDFELRRES
ncbi:MAG: hypothetical protein M0021_06590 [Clostridia bacterium]|nr:hypothetical protein [Clostridia bacterium]